MFHRIGLALIVCAAVLAAPALAATYEYLENTPPLLERLTPEVVATAFPGATRVELVDDGGPPAAAAYIGENLAGYLFSALDISPTPGYSGVPFDIVAGVDLAGNVTGSIILFHRDPHVEHNVISEFSAGATISARIMNAAIAQGARIVLRFRNGAMDVTEPTIDAVTYRQMNDQELIDAGAVTRIVVTNTDLEAILADAGMSGRELEIAPRNAPVYVDFRFGLGTVLTIGGNGAGLSNYESFHSSFPEGSQAIVFGSTGTYNFQGHKFQNRANDYRLERVRVLQGDNSYEFTRDTYIRDASSPGRSVRLGTFNGLAVLPPDSGFDPFAPWTAELYAYVKNADGSLEPVLIASGEYQLPPQYVLMPQPEPLPAWMQSWHDDREAVFILGGALIVLTLILTFQAAISRSRQVHRVVRTGFLIFTLVWLGWIAGGQLSILHLLNYLQAPFQNFDWTFYLAEPLIVILTVYTAISLVLIGRGVFCGWLCPFGALQELLAQISRALRLPQWNPSESIQKRLWMGKYISLAAVVGLTFAWPSAGAAAVEVEPFQTAITSYFQRGAPYLLYAGALLTVGLFTERAFCRFLCPLGGAFALLDRLHLLNLLKRRPECGSPCQLCARSCPVRAIEKSGKIKTAECFQCLDCQVEYFDDERCPPLVTARKSRERAARGPQTVFAYTPSRGGAAS